MHIYHTFSFCFIIIIIIIIIIYLNYLKKGFIGLRDQACILCLEKGKDKYEWGLDPAYMS